jgi:hypothetical protein
MPPTALVRTLDLPASGCFMTGAGGGRPMLPAFSAATSSGEAAVDLYWLPLGAGGRSVRLNGIVFEAISARIERRSRCDVYHSALEIRVAGHLYAVEMTPIPNGRRWERGVVAEGAVGTRSAGRLRIFRYEVRRWRDGVIPDLGYAVASPIRLSQDPALAHASSGCSRRCRRRPGAATSWVQVRCGRATRSSRGFSLGPASTPTRSLSRHGHGHRDGMPASPLPDGRSRRRSSPRPRDRSAHTSGRACSCRSCGLIGTIGPAGMGELRSDLGS